MYLHLLTNLYFFYQANSTESTNTKVTKIRLINPIPPHHPWEGRVEVLHDDVWGTICDDGFNIIDAHVICRMMNYR